MSLHICCGVECPEIGFSLISDRIQYGYDRAGNRVWRKNPVADALGKRYDELYGYDAAQRLKTMDRGTLVFSGSQPSTLNPRLFSQCWSLDPTGNWKGFREDADGNGTWDLVQSRTANAVNEITDVTNTTGAAWIDPAYSRAGNMTTMPRPSDPTQSYTATYDAWNRLVKLAAGANTVSEYQYDGAKRRILQKTYTGGSLTETRHLYYTEPAKWQVLEERVGTSPDSAAAERQFVWGLRYIDDLLLRDRDTDANGTLDERLYACQDANWNVTAVVNGAGTVQERYSYTAYGQPTFLTEAFASRTNSSYAWESLYCGYRYEAGTGLFHVRNRSCMGTTGVWTQRDPIRYADGPNLYQYAIGNPLSVTDSHGCGPPVVPDIPPNPTTPPGPGWVWGGQLPVGGPNGGWVAPNGESLHWDLSPHDNIGPHWDWNDQNGNKWTFDPNTGKWWPGKNNNPNKPQPIFPDGTLQTVGTVVVVAGALYITYRCVRMIPSLLPPLWPTIPANLAIP